MENIEKNYVQSSRLRSSRTKLRLRKEAFDKYLLRLDRKVNELRHHDVHYECLPQPVQRGYVRTFQLTDEAMHSPNAETYRNVLALINTYQYSYYPIFDDKLGKKKSKKLKRAYDIQEVRNISTYEYSKLGKKEKLMFKPIYYYKDKERHILEYCFMYPGLLKLVVIPYMVDKVERLDCDVKREIAFYEKIIYHHYSRLTKMHGYSYKNTYSVYKDDVAKAKAQGFKNVPVWKRADWL